MENDDERYIFLFFSFLFFSFLFFSFLFFSFLFFSFHLVHNMNIFFCFPLEPFLLSLLDLFSLPSLLLQQLIFLFFSLLFLLSFSLLFPLFFFSCRHDKFTKNLLMSLPLGAGIGFVVGFLNQWFRSAPDASSMYSTKVPIIHATNDDDYI